MKIYTFPYGGSCGKGDTWDSELAFELTDEEAARLEASARKASRWHLDEDPELEDIYDRISDFIIADNLRMMEEDGRLDELREEYENEDEMPSDEDLVLEDMGSLTICYPEELQYLGDGDA